MKPRIIVFGLLAAVSGHVVSASRAELRGEARIRRDAVRADVMLPRSELDSCLAGPVWRT